MSTTDNRIGVWLIAGTGDNERDTMTGELLYWSNRDGWVDILTADRFSDTEMRTLRLPVGGAWRSVKVGP